MILFLVAICFTMSLEAVACTDTSNPKDTKCFKQKTSLKKKNSNEKTGFSPYYNKYKSKYKGFLGGHFQKNCKYTWRWKFKKVKGHWVWLKIKKKCKKPVSCSSPSHS